MAYDITFGIRLQAVYSAGVLSCELDTCRSKVRDGNGSGSDRIGSGCGRDARTRILDTGYWIQDTR